MRYCLIQVLQKFAHAGNWDSKGLNKEKQLLWLQVLQGCNRQTLSPQTSELSMEGHLYYLIFMLLSGPTVTH